MTSYKYGAGMNLLDPQNLKGDKSTEIGQSMKEKRRGPWQKISDHYDQTIVKGPSVKAAAGLKASMGGRKAPANVTTMSKTSPGTGVSDAELKKMRKAAGMSKDAWEAAKRKADVRD